MASLEFEIPVASEFDSILLKAVIYIYSAIFEASDSKPDFEEF